MTIRHLHYIVLLSEMSHHQEMKLLNKPVYATDLL